MTRPPRPGARRRTVLSALSAGALAGLAGCAGRDDGEDTADPSTMQETATDETDTDETATETDDGDDRPEREPATPTWTTGTKYGVGTVADHHADAPSRTWFTLTDGALTEPRFPRVDCLNARHVSFVVTDGDGYVARTHAPPGTEDSIERSVEPTASDALAWRHTATETGDAYDWALAVEHVADPERDALVLDVAFEATDALSLYVLATPTPSGRAAHTAGEQRAHANGSGHVLAATETDPDGVAVRDSDDEPVVVSLALAADDGGFTEAAVLEEASEAADAFAESGVLPDAGGDDGSHGTAAAEGVLELVGALATDATAASRTLSLGFADDGDADAATDVAATGAASGFERAREGYVASWREYLANVVVPESVAGDDELAAQYNAAAMVLKAVEDKTYRGASIASPSVPWGSEVSARDAGDHGYNFVWARDLYQVFTAFDALGDPESAAEHLEYVFAFQHDGEGFLPQNTWVDGRTRWGGEQLDEIAFPLVMVDQLRRRHDYGFAEAGYDYDASRAMAEYLVHGGPRTDQERWEEEDGFSPSTIAATVAGLAAAARLAESEGREDDALVYRAVADHWQRSVVDWTATTTGVDPDGDLAAADREHGGSGRAPSPDAETPYFLRVTDDADPDDGAARSLANGGPTLDERGIVDAGFLELVRLGVLPHDHPVVENSLSVVDDTIRVETPNGPAWYRYNGDGYGEVGTGGPDEDPAVDPGTPWSVTHAGRGRLWPILTGERAEYELLAGTESGDLAPERLLSAMQRFANDGRMIPEQVWDREEPTAYGWEFGEGTASATPLAWSMAGFVRLARSLDAGTPVERPRATASRYVEDGGAPEPPALSVEWPDSVVDAAEVELAGETEAVTLLVRTPQETVRVDPSDGSFAATIPLESGRNPITVVAAGEGAPGDRGLAAAQRTISYVE